MAEQELIYPRWMYRRGDGAAAMVESQQHLDQFKDKHLWQDVPWRPGKVKFCAGCEDLRELVKELESDMDGKDEIVKAELAEKDRTIELLRQELKSKKGQPR